MKKLLLILLTLLLCTGCAAKTAQENPNPADKKESITEEQPENTASLACRTVKGEAVSIALSLMNSGKSAAEVPYLEGIGVASFDQNKACYLTVSFAQDALTKEQAEEFAKEIRWESGQ